MIRHFAPSLVACFLLVAAPLHGAEDESFDPHSVDEKAAIACALSAPEYMGFALSVSGEDGIAATRGWRKLEGENPFLSEYELPAPIRIMGHETRRIAFSGSAIMAVLDVADPGDLARGEGIANSLSAGPLGDALLAWNAARQGNGGKEPAFRKFLGEKVLSDVTEPAEGDSTWGQRTTVTRTISNVTTHPGKTFYGCSYRIELLDRQGNPL
jgi:hypothetical protein